MLTPVVVDICAISLESIFDVSRAIALDTTSVKVDISDCSNCSRMLLFLSPRMN